MEWFDLFVPESGDKPRVDDRRLLSGMNTKLYAVTDTRGRPLKFLMTAGLVSGDTDASALLGRLPAAEWLFAERVMMPTGSGRR